MPEHGAQFICHTIIMRWLMCCVAMSWLKICRGRGHALISLRNGQFLPCVHVIRCTWLLDLQINENTTVQNPMTESSFRREVTSQNTKGYFVHIMQPKQAEGLRWGFQSIISTQTDPELKCLSNSTPWPDKSVESFLKRLSREKETTW